ncbi:MAG: FAD-binding protein, partial [Gammaproteobacteria bacterium]|nr:FAD-binding protein [Gammaproteobacteria bacterium]
MTTEHYDAAIVGGGLVGLSLAAMLGGNGFKTALVEAREPQLTWAEGSIDLRVYAISRVSQQLLEDTGAWRSIAPYACAYHDMHVWDAGGSGEIHFDSAELGEPDLGHIVESRVIEKALFDVIQALPEVDQFCPANVVSIDESAGQQHIVL